MTGYWHRSPDRYFKREKLKKFPKVLEKNKIPFIIDLTKATKHLPSKLLQISDVLLPFATVSIKRLQVIFLLPNDYLET